MLRTRPEPEIVRQFIRIANKEPDADAILRAMPPGNPQWRRALSATVKDCVTGRLDRKDIPAEPIEWGVWSDFHILGLGPIEEFKGDEGTLGSERIGDWRPIDKKSIEKRYWEMVEATCEKWLRETENWRRETAETIKATLGSIAEQNSSGENASTYALQDCPEFLSRVSLRMVNGRAVVEPLQPLKQFLDEVELSRIKRCSYEKCGKLFWAGRLTRPCCSDACGNAYRQKKHRDQERENRPYKKRMKLRKRGSAK